MKTVEKLLILAMLFVAFSLPACSQSDSGLGTTSSAVFSSIDKG